MKEITTQVLIKANPSKVWEVFTFFDGYGGWNPFILKVKGKVEVGNRIRVRIQPPGASGMTFTPVVTVYNPQRELRWLGHLLFKGLFDGEHSFRLIDNHNGTTTFIQSETFKGILVPFFRKMIEVNTMKGMEMMNKSLKRKVEKISY